LEGGTNRAPPTPPLRSGRTTAFAPTDDLPAAEAQVAIDAKQSRKQLALNASIAAAKALDCDDDFFPADDSLLVNCSHVLTKISTIQAQSSSFL
jgi:hypothetical protein